MTRFWSTVAIVNAIVMTAGDVDIGTYVSIWIEVIALVQLYRGEKRERVAP